MTVKKKGQAVKAAGGQMTVATHSLELVQSVAYNVRQEVIVVTRDKIELCLTKHVKTMEQRQAWLVPFGVLLATVTAIVTCTFHDWLNVKSENWRALFIVCALVSGYRTVYLLWKRSGAKSVEDVINELKAHGTSGTVTEQLTEVVAAETTETTTAATEQPMAQSAK